MALPDYLLFVQKETGRGPDEHLDLVFESSALFSGMTMRQYLLGSHHSKEDWLTSDGSYPIWKMPTRKKGVFFDWDQACLLKEHLLNPPVLSAPGSSSYTFIAVLDGSLGALLAQHNEEGKE